MSRSSHSMTLHDKTASSTSLPNRMMQNREIGTDQQGGGGPSNANTVSREEAVLLSLYPNRWTRMRAFIREPAAEFFGVMILVLFGTAGNAQGTLFDSANVTSSSKGGWLDVAFGWGVGLGLGAWVSAGISGGHINPAVTISLATFRGFPWRKVPIYILAQLLGGILGAAITYANYHNAIDLFEGGVGIRTVPGTASLFGTYPLPYLSNASAFFDEYIGAFLLVIVLLAVVDGRNGPPPAGMVPLVLFLVLFGLGIAFGPQTGFAVNPARDLGPRILTAMAGYGREVFNFRHQYWLWGGVIAPIFGALSATAVYDTFIYTGEDSIMNRPNKRVRDFRASPPIVVEKTPVGAEAV